MFSLRFQNLQHDFYRRRILKYVTLAIYALVLCIAYIMIYDWCFGTGIINEQAALTMHAIYDHVIEGSVLNPSNVYNTTTFLIGIGCVKCGTSSFAALLTDYSTKWNTVTLPDSDLDDRVPYHWWTTFIESHFFHQCPKWIQFDRKYWDKSSSKCSFPKYLDFFNVPLRMNQMTTLNHSHLILSEKTTTYYFDDGAAYFLTFYGHFYDLKYYILLRNPITRFYSNLWNQRAAHFVVNPLNRYHGDDSSLQIQRMNHRIESVIRFYSKRYPASDRLINALRISSDRIRNRNADLDEDEVVRLYLNVIYEHSVHRVSIYENPILSCYYPMLLMWNKYWIHWNLNAKIGRKYALFERLKVIQTEQTFDANQRMDILQELMCWTMGGESGDRDLKNCRKRMEAMEVVMDPINEKEQDPRRKKYTPENVDIMHSNITVSLKEFYADCNQRLYWYLEDYPQFMLSNRNFVPWW